VSGPFSGLELLIMNRPSVLITGGAGFLGINLVRYLLNRDYCVTSLDLLPFDYPERGQIREIRGDTRNQALVDQAIKGNEYVVHTAAALPLYPADEIYATDVVGTRIVMQAARQHGVRCAVHISSTAVYGIPDHHPLIEDDKLDGVGPYGQAKIQAEMVCLEERSRGLVVPIIRPKSFIGPERLGVFGLLYDWALDGKGFPLIGNGKNRYQLLDVEDLCEAIHLCLTKEPSVVNDTFNIGAKQYTTMGEDYQAVLDAVGKRRRVVPFPAGPAIVVLRMLERLGVSPLYKWVYETACHDSFVSIEKAERVLGYAPKYSNKDALLRNLEWYREHRSEFAKQSGITHRVPWKQGAIGLLKYAF
jgi:nucleoside-diphosphate-sugar epimerase